MPIRFLINLDGAPFDAAELDSLTVELAALDDDGRKKQRNDNATAIASVDAAAILTVAGPGTGKSTLFKQRIEHWLNQIPSARILALSFVRKLVADLDADIQSDTKLTDAQKKQVDVYTLHKYARSIVEKNGGTREWKFAPHLRIIVEQWKAVLPDANIEFCKHTKADGTQKFRNRLAFNDYIKSLVAARRH